MSVEVRATVMSVEVDPTRRDRQRRWLARVHVDGVLDGECQAEEITLLVHSPSRTFRTGDPVGQAFVLTLDEPIGDPYAGPLEVRREPMPPVEAEPLEAEAD